jgi:hypothetical protein
MMVRVPWRIPAAPHPATTLPIMNTVEVGAAAQRHDPASKMIIERR